MSIKKLFATLLVLTTVMVSAQNANNTYDYELSSLNDLTINMDLSSISNTATFSEVAISLEKYQNDQLYTNFMILEVENQNELEESMNMMFRRHPMEKTGRVLTYIGVPLAIIGGIMVAGADELYYECVNGNCSGDARGGFGIVALAAGVGLGTTGGILWGIGRKK